MNMFKKAAVSFAAVSLVAAPVAASAASIADLRAVSVADEASEVEGTSWVLIVLALGAAIFGIVELAGGSDNSPTSP